MTGATDKLIIEKYFDNDEAIHNLYPKNISRMAARHWTPIRVIKEALAFLNTNNNCHILDIGSGAGKFCLIGAKHLPNVNFYGIEQRGYLVEQAKSIQEQLGLDNIAFMEGNFTTLDFKKFDHFYFFNSFWENLDDTDKIDDTIDYSETLYDYYVTYLRNALAEMPPGTRVVTYHSLLDEIPDSYRLVHTKDDGMLNFWTRR